MLLNNSCTVQEEAFDSWGWTPLHYAAWHNKIQMVKLLLSHGASVDAKDSEASQQDAAYIARFHSMVAAGQALKVQYMLCLCRVQRC